MSFLQLGNNLIYFENISDCSAPKNFSSFFLAFSTLSIILGVVGRLASGIDDSSNEEK